MNPFHFEKKYLKNADWLLNLSILVFLIASSLMVYSTSRNIVENQPYYYVIRHIIAMGLGMGLFLISSYLDYHFWQNTQLLLYVVMLVMLTVVLLIGMEGDYGGQSWIPMGPISLQPVELAKIILILSLAGFIQNEKRCNSLLCLFWLLMIMAIPLGLVMLQPDLGSGLVFLAIWLSIVFMSGVKMQYLFGIMGAGLAVFPFLWSKLEEYQKIRILIFTNLEYYKTNSEYAKYTWQLIQSIIAIGSGRFWGRGFLQGTQTQLEFVPAKHSDMIFSALAEEFGFLGSGILIIVYLFLIYRIFRVGQLSNDGFARLICAGMGSMLLFHLLVNVGMTLGVMPVIGIPWPLMSYASSNLMAVLWGLGIVNSIAMRSNRTLFGN